MDSAKQRIREYLVSNKISFAKAERMAGVSRGFLNVDSEIGSTALRKFATAFPELDIRYVITGTRTNIQPSAENIRSDIQAVKNAIEELSSIIKEKYQ